MSAESSQLLSPQAAERRWSIARHWPEFGALVVAALALIPLLHVTVGPDVSWQLWIGRHMNAGVPLYNWIMETNPPLWFWMAQPISAFAEAFRAEPDLILIVAVWMFMAISLALSAAVIMDLEPQKRAAILGAQLLGMLLLSFSELGQRDHLTLIGSIPYALLIARRGEGRAVSWPLAITIGLFAAPVLALKNYFVLIPAALEVWLSWRTRRLLPFRPETIALFLVAIIYAATVIVYSPIYLSAIVPMLSAAYGDFHGPPLLVIFNRMTCAAVAVSFYFWFFRRTLPDQTQVLLVLAAAFFGIYFLQFKGFVYHLDPVVVSLVMALVTHGVIRRQHLHQADRNTKAFFAFCLALLIVPALMTGPYRNRDKDVMDDFFSGLPAGSTIAALTPDPALIWLMITDYDIRFGQRYYHAWMLHAVAKHDAPDIAMPAELAELLLLAQRDMVQDITCNQPDVILIDNRRNEPGTNYIQSLFERDPAFAALIQSYAPSERVGLFDVLTRVAPLPSAEGLACMPIGFGKKAPAVNS
jgi:hypothetical protein